MVKFGNNRFDFDNDENLKSICFIYLFSVSFIEDISLIWFLIYAPTAAKKYPEKLMVEFDENFVEAVSSVVFVIMTLWLLMPPSGISKSEEHFAEILPRCPFSETMFGMITWTNSSSKFMLTLSVHATLPTTHLFSKKFEGHTFLQHLKHCPMG